MSPEGAREEFGHAEQAQLRPEHLGRRQRHAQHRHLEYDQQQGQQYGGE
ncbi:hypothetical protein [Streptomyces sp. NBC_00019]